MTAIALDVHAHVIPVHAGRLNALNGVHWDAEKPSLTLDGAVIGLADLFYPARLTAWMEKHQVEKAYISIPPPLYRQKLGIKDARIWTAYVNDGLMEITEQQARLQALLHLPMEHPELAIEAASSCTSKNHAGFALAAGGATSILYSNSAYDPLWQHLGRANAFVFLHPGKCEDPRLKAFYLDNLLGNPHETALAASHLILANVPARFPGIRFCLAHAGGSFPAIAGRLQQGFDSRRPGLDTSIESPLAAAKRFYCDCISHSPDALALAGQVFGPDHIYFGSDWPFPMGIRHPEKDPKPW